MLKVDNKTPERRRRTGVFINNFEHIPHLVFHSVCIIKFE